jgi:DNA-binding transcriptional MerR regulator
MTDTWTLAELVAEAANRLAALPAPKNGQVRAVPDERTIRYYATIGLLDRPAAMRGRTALYGRRHLAQVVAIKRMQSAGHSLAEIQSLWPTLDEGTLGRMSGVQVGSGKAKPVRRDFWKREAEMQTTPPREADMSAAQPPKPIVASPSGAPTILPVPSFTPYPTPVGAGRSVSAATTITVPLDGNASIVIALPDDAELSLSAADVRALRAAAAPLVAELAKRGLIDPAGRSKSDQLDFGSAGDTLEEEP